jgi:histidine triad (HIT) family protein
VTATPASCILCGIVRGEAAASFVYRDDLLSAFLDIRPVTPGHALVIPNGHTPLIADVDEHVRDHLFRVGVRLGGAIRRAALGAEGIDYFLADGEAAGQEIPHAHLHVLPRFHGDGFTLDAAAWREPPPSRSELDHHAESIRSQL